MRQIAVIAISMYLGAGLFAGLMMQRNAIGGHLWRDGDCEKCPAYEIEGD